MNKMNKTMLGGLALAAAFLSGCSNAEYKPLDNSIYINGAAADPLRIITVGDASSTTSILVRSAAPAKQTITVNLAVQQSALDAYNKRNDANYVLLPAEFYTLSATSLKIEQGKVSTPELTVTIKPFTEELSKSGKKYAIPLSITSVSGADLSVLQGEKDFIIACDQVIKTKAIKLLPQQGMKTSFAEGVKTDTWSVEMRVKSDDIRPNYNNQSFMGISSGIEGGGEGSGFIFGRWEGDVLQFKVNGHDGVSATIKPESNKWYHVALVCANGTLSIYVNGQLNKQEQNLKFATVGQYKDFTFAYPRWRNHPYRKSDYYMSEIRFWNRALTAAQIRRNRFSIDPATPGLVAYWKLDEGTGTTFKDATGHGHDLELYHGEGQRSAPSQWVDIRSDED